MKLRNKKTGVIYKIEDIDLGNNADGIWLGMTKYNSLAELNEEWEDYEEPKGYWYINEFGTPTEITHTRENIYDKQRKNFGNCFETKEEAEQAVEKLKAWKLLKDESNIKFNGIIRDEKAMIKGVKVTYDRHEVTFDRMRECMCALHLLFGGEQ